MDSRTGTTTYTWDNAGNVATVSYPNGQQATFQYDQENRVTGLSSQPASYTCQREPTSESSESVIQEELEEIDIRNYPITPVIPPLGPPEPNPIPEGEGRAPL